MIKRFFIVVLLFVLSSCNKEIKPERPENLIEKEQMIAILHDLYLINGAKSVNRPLLERQAFAPDLYVYNKHGIDSLQFANSNAYYSYDGEGYKAMIEEVLQRLEQKKGEIQELQKAEQAIRKKKQDSIRQVNKTNAQRLDTTSRKLKQRIKQKN